MSDADWILCINGRPHVWQQTGNGFFSWAGTNAGAPAPTDAPFTAEEQCMTCGAIRYVPPTVPMEIRT
jgi:hypothetical protein